MESQTLGIQTRSGKCLDHAPAPGLRLTLSDDTDDEPAKGPSRTSRRATRSMCLELQALEPKAAEPSSPDAGEQPARERCRPGRRRAVWRQGHMQQLKSRLPGAIIPGTLEAYHDEHGMYVYRADEASDDFQRPNPIRDLVRNAMDSVLLKPSSEFLPAPSHNPQLLALLERQSRALTWARQREWALRQRSESQSGASGHSLGAPMLPSEPSSANPSNSRADHTKQWLDSSQPQQHYHHPQHPIMYQHQHDPHSHADHHARVSQSSFSHLPNVISPPPPHMPTDDEVGSPPSNPAPQRPLLSTIVQPNKSAPGLSAPQQPHHVQPHPPSPNINQQPVAHHQQHPSAIVPPSQSQTPGQTPHISSPKHAEAATPNQLVLDNATALSDMGLATHPKHRRFSKRNGLADKLDVNGNPYCKGVLWEKSRNKYKAVYYRGAIKRFLGYFTSCEAAARAADLAQLLLNPKAPDLNYPQQDYAKGSESLARINKLLVECQPVKKVAAPKPDKQKKPPPADLPQLSVSLRPGRRNRKRQRLSDEGGCYMEEGEAAVQEALMNTLANSDGWAYLGLLAQQGLEAEDNSGLEHIAHLTVDQIQLLQQQTVSMLPVGAALGLAVLPSGLGVSGVGGVAGQRLLGETGVHVATTQVEMAAQAAAMAALAAVMAAAEVQPVGAEVAAAGVAKTGEARPHGKQVWLARAAADATMAQQPCKQQQEQPLPPPPPQQQQYTIQQGRGHDADDADDMDLPDPLQLQQAFTQPMVEQDFLQAHTTEPQQHQQAGRALDMPVDQQRHQHDMTDDQHQQQGPLPLDMQHDLQRADASDGVNHVPSSFDHLPDHHDDLNHDDMASPALPGGPLSRSAPQTHMGLGHEQLQGPMQQAKAVHAQQQGSMQQTRSMHGHALPIKQLELEESHQPMQQKGGMKRVLSMQQMPQHASPIMQQEFSMQRIHSVRTQDSPAMQQQPDLSPQAEHTDTPKDMVDAAQQPVAAPPCKNMTMQEGLVEHPKAVHAAGQVLDSVGMSLDLATALDSLPLPVQLPDHDNLDQPKLNQVLGVHGSLAVPEDMEALLSTAACGAAHLAEAEAAAQQQQQRLDVRVDVDVHAQCSGVQHENQQQHGQLHAEHVRQAPLHEDVVPAHDHAMELHGPSSTYSCSGTLAHASPVMPMRGNSSTPAQHHHATTFHVGALPLAAHSPARAPKKTLPKTTTHASPCRLLVPPHTMVSPINQQNQRQHMEAQLSCNASQLLHISQQQQQQILSPRPTPKDQASLPANTRQQLLVAALQAGPGVSAVDFEELDHALQQVPPLQQPHHPAATQPLSSPVPAHATVPSQLQAWAANAPPAAIAPVGVVGHATSNDAIVGSSVDEIVALEVEALFMEDDVIPDQAPLTHMTHAVGAPEISDRPVTRVTVDEVAREILAHQPSARLDLLMQPDANVACNQGNVQNASGHSSSAPHVITSLDGPSPPLAPPVSVTQSPHRPSLSRVHALMPCPATSDPHATAPGSAPDVSGCQQHLQQPTQHTKLSPTSRNCPLQPPQPQRSIGQVAQLPDLQQPAAPPVAHPGAGQIPQPPQLPNNHQQPAVQAARRASKELIRLDEFIGVFWHSGNRMYRAYSSQMCDDGVRRKVKVGEFTSPEEAARAYDGFVLRTEGPGVRTNFPYEQYMHIMMGPGTHDGPPMMLHHHSHMTSVGPPPPHPLYMMRTPHGGAGGGTSSKAWGAHPHMSRSQAGSMAALPVGGYGYSGCVGSDAGDNQHHKGMPDATQKVDKEGNTAGLGPGHDVVEGNAGAADRHGVASTAGNHDGRQREEEVVGQVDVIQLTTVPRMTVSHGGCPGVRLTMSDAGSGGFGLEAGSWDDEADIGINEPLSRGQGPRGEALADVAGMTGAVQGNITTVSATTLDHHQNTLDTRSPPIGFTGQRPDVAESNYEAEHQHKQHQPHQQQHRHHKAAGSVLLPPGSDHFHMGTSAASAASAACKTLAGCLADTHVAATGTAITSATGMAPGRVGPRMAGSTPVVHHWPAAPLTRRPSNPVPSQAKADLHTQSQPPHASQGLQHQPSQHLPPQHQSLQLQTPQHEPSQHLALNSQHQPSQRQLSQQQASQQQGSIPQHQASHSQPLGSDDGSPPAQPNPSYQRAQPKGQQLITPSEWEEGSPPPFSYPGHHLHAPHHLAPAYPHSLNPYLLPGYAPSQHLPYPQSYHHHAPMPYSQTAYAPAAHAPQHMPTQHAHYRHAAQPGAPGAAHVQQQGMPGAYTAPVRHMYPPPQQY